MSQKRKVQRANHNAREAKKAEQVIYWIIGVLIVLAVIMVISLGVRFA